MKKPRPRFPRVPAQELADIAWQGELRQSGPNGWTSSHAAQEARRALTPSPLLAKPSEVAEPREGQPVGPRTSAPESVPHIGETALQKVLPSGKIGPRTGAASSCGASNTATPSQVRDSTGRISIDWLTISQTHTQAPKVGESVILFCDLETGEVRSEAIRGLQHRGSHDSTLQVRCDGRRVEVSGNPSKWGRFDNVYGHASIDDCIEVYNSVLRSLDLPEFRDDEQRTAVAPFQYQRSDAVAPSGPVITRVDLCRNWAAGSAAAARSIVAALGSVVRMGKCGWTSPDGNTVAWGIGSRYVYSKYYLKGPELRKHPGSDPDYSAKLADWCDTVGLVRQEVSLKSMLLKRNGLDRPGAWAKDGGAVVEQLMDEYSQHRQCGAQAASYDDLFRVLRESGVPVSRARAAQTALQAYLNGFRFVVGENISRSAFYRLRADVRAAGVDIAAPLNVATLPVRVRELSLSPAVAPDWYRWAG